MSDDDLPPGIAPADLTQADDMDTLEDDDGRQYRVLVSQRTGGRELVNEDVVSYDTVDHPALTGLIAFFNVGGAFLAPLAGAYYLSAGVSLTTVGTTLAGLLGAWVLGNGLLYYTVVGDWLFRFLEWYDNRALIMAKREGGEVA